MATPIDHEALMNQRLMTQYKNATNLKKILGTFIDQVQDLEDVLQGYNTETALSTATGQQLDNMGKILNVPRSGYSDSVYRIILYTKIAQIFSEGNIENLISIYKTLMGANVIELNEQYPASITLLARDPSPIGDESLIVVAIREAKLAGVEVALMYSTTPAFAFLADPDTNTDGFSSVSAPTTGGILSSVLY